MNEPNAMSESGGRIPGDQAQTLRVGLPCLPSLISADFPIRLGSKQSDARLLVKLAVSFR
jgi:hypothetical protein